MREMRRLRTARRARGGRDSGNCDLASYGNRGVLRGAHLERAGSGAPRAGDKIRLSRRKIATIVAQGLRYLLQEEFCTTKETVEHNLI